METHQVSRITNIFKFLSFWLAKLVPIDYVINSKKSSLVFQTNVLAFKYEHFEKNNNFFVREK